MKCIASVIVLFLSLLVGGCFSFDFPPYARVVKLMPGNGGTIALRLNYDQEDREFAMQKMKQNCGPKNVSIIEEGEVVVGQTVHSIAERPRRRGQIHGVDSDGIPIRSRRSRMETWTSSTVQQEKEWRLKYSCL